MSKVLYIPLDERTCNYDFPQKLARMTDDIELLVPPAEMMGFKKRPADIEQLWAWVAEHAPECSYAILSVDTLVYGNIINSRTHHKSEAECIALVNQFRKLKQDNPELHIHAFNLVARVAAYNSDSEDPDYWAEYGLKIWRYAYFKDKQGRGLLSDAESSVLSVLESDIPEEYLQDFLNRRAVDRMVNLQCVDLVEENVFDMLTIPKDDTAEYGYAAMDHQALTQRICEKQLMNRILVYPGADEVGSVLFARVFNQIKGYTPRVYVRYSSTFGPYLVPLYEDRPMNEGIKAQIHSMGGVMSDSADQSDCMLAVNAPGVHMIESSAQFHKDITFSTHRNLNDFFAMQQYYHKTYCRPVGLADVATSNGCENECMDLARLNHSFDFLTAVGGWNTTANTVGVVLAQLAIASYYHGFNQAPDRLQLSRNFMLEHLTADWLYQSNVLPQYLQETQEKWNPFALDDHYDETVSYFKEHIQALLNAKFPEGLFGKRIVLTKLSFQWNGAFYVHLSVAQI